MSISARKKEKKKILKNRGNKPKTQADRYCRVFSLELDGAIHWGLKTVIKSL